MASRFFRGCLLSGVLVLGAVPALLAVAPPVHAQQPKLDAARARELFREALALEAAGDYASALGKLQQVASFKTTPQVSFNLGVCSEKLGKLVVALGHYRLALADAEQDPALKKVASEATRAIGELEPKIPTLTLKRGQGADTAVIQIDGKEVASAAVGTAMLVDPGPHTVEATAEGYQRFKKQLRVETSEKATLEITLAPAPKAVPVPTPTPSATASAPAPTASTDNNEPPPVTPTPATSASSTAGTGGGITTTLGWIALGVGVAGGITSGIFFAKRSSALSDLDSMCGADKQSCPASARSTMDDGKNATLIGNLGLVVGAVGIVTGVILLAAGGGKDTKPAGTETTSRVRLLPGSLGSWAGATIDTRF